MFKCGGADCSVLEEEDNEGIEEEYNEGIEEEDSSTEVGNATGDGDGEVRV